ncbi:MAG: hypothetical protein M3430_20525 [Acidobacteriota bacterium]|nr:hypothetical protein [Acidobacteriota bacterium]
MSQKVLEQKRPQELERKALLLLEDVITDTSALQLPENRALVQATSADLLWKHDEERARSLFQDALSSLAQVKPPAGIAAPPDDPDFTSFRLRQQVLQLVARRAPQMALEFLRATRRPAPAGTEASEQQSDPELLLEQSLAAQVATNDPKLALQIAEESLSKGISRAVLPLLHRLLKKDREAGAKLGSSVVAKLRSVNFNANPEAAEIAFSLLSMSTQPQTNEPNAKQQQDTMKAEPVLGLQNTRDLVDALATAALSGSPGSPMFEMLSSIMPQVEQYAPARLPLLRRKLAQFQQELDPHAKTMRDLESLMSGGTTPEAILGVAAKAPREMRSVLYQQAAWQAMQKGDTDRARQIIHDNVQNSPEREQLLGEIDRQVLARATAQGNIEEARQMLAGVSSKNDRAEALAQLATSAMKVGGNRKLVGQLLDEAASLIRGRARNSKGLQVQLQVSHAFANVEPARSFEILEPLIAQTNELIQAAAVLDGFGGQAGIFRRGEIVMTSAMAVADRFSRYGLDFALADFERTKEATNKFDRSELRILTRLLVVQAILSDRSDAENSDEELRETALFSRVFTTP